VPIDVQVDELPRFGDGVEREIISIVAGSADQRRPAFARTPHHHQGLVVQLARPAPVVSPMMGAASRASVRRRIRLTSMQERADRIGASLTIVTAPRSGTEVVLAWEPSSLPTQVYAVN
jgi:hypothetical protein